MEEQRANMSNWQQHPHSEWAFRNVDALLKTAVIEQSKNSGDDFPASPVSLDHVKVPAQDGTMLSLPDYLKSTQTDGFLVLKEGHVIYEFYDHGNTPSSLHILMSVTKSIVGLLLGIVSENGALDVDAPVSKYVPEVANTAYAGATLRHLIDMRAGAKAEMWDPGYRVAMAWQPSSEEDAAKYPKGLRGYFATLNVASEPHNGAFSYVSQNTDLVGLAIERATGQPLPELLSELFWKPLGAHDEALITIDAEGVSRAAGGMCTTLRDLARIGQLIAEGGRCGATQVVSRAWIEDIFTNGDFEAWQQGAFGPLMKLPGREMNYRSGWYIAKGSPDIVSASGLNGQKLLVDRDNNLVIAMTASQKDRVDVRAIVLAYHIIDEIRKTTS